MRNKPSLPIIAVIVSAIALGVAFVGQQSTAVPTAQPQVVMHERKHHNYESGDLLRAVAVIGDEGSFGWISEIQVHRDLLLVFDREPQHGSEQLILLDKASGAVRARLAAPGNGTTDIANTVSMGPVYGSARGGEFFVWDYPNARVVTYRIDGTEVQRTGAYAQPEKIPLFQMAWLAGDVIVANGLFSEELLRYYTVDRDADALQFRQTTGKVLHPREVPPVMRQLSRNVMATDPASDRIVIAFSYLNRLQFYDSVGALVRVVGGPEEVIPKYKVEGLRFVPDGAAGFRMAYVDLATTEDHVYALFSSQPAPNLSVADEVHVFSWTGELVKVFGLDAGVNWLAVDPQTRRLYGVQLEPHPTIRVYELPILE